MITQNAYDLDGVLTGNTSTILKVIILMAAGSYLFNRADTPLRNFTGIAFNLFDLF